MNYTHDDDHQGGSAPIQSSVLPHHQHPHAHHQVHHLHHHEEVDDGRDDLEDMEDDLDGDHGDMGQSHMGHDMDGQMGDEDEDGTSECYPPIGPDADIVRDRRDASPSQGDHQAPHQVCPAAHDAHESFPPRSQAEEGCYQGAGAVDGSHVPRDLPLVPQSASAEQAGAAHAAAECHAGSQPQRYEPAGHVPGNASGGLCVALFVRFLSSHLFSL